MRWRGRSGSSNIEDRRGQGGGGSRFPLGGGGGKLGLLGTVIVVLVGLYFGVDPTVLLQGGSPPDQGQTVDTQSPEARESAQFVSVVLADTEQTWHGLFEQSGGRYEEPTLVLFSGATRSACGVGQSATGPFYCPGDRKVYLDTTFFDELDRRFGAPGDFAQAYVIAHEVGHHVQTLMGISQQVDRLRGRVAQAEYNAMSVRLELQADCFAGVWAHHAHNSRALLEDGDVEEALAAASAIGDDRLQRQSQGHVTPDAFTHGTSAQRVHWFRQGMDQGSMAACDTFSAAAL
ncbi:neutral zinc metallopeptidase [Iodidimonas sp. SYSU 1G8]|uniref:KPN_02809 family neutral zinc metallopeptidase n=1 Tax=Iodidimonas sp. SYSU 1G8 TaxID=3133967 RepID=UPI0031FE9D4C